MSPRPEGREGSRRSGRRAARNSPARTRSRAACGPAAAAWPKQAPGRRSPRGGRSAFVHPRSEANTSARLFISGMRSASKAVIGTGRGTDRVPDSSERETERPMFPLLAIGALLAAWTPSWLAVRPADPPAVVDNDDPALGPAFGEAQLAPWFTTPALKSALSEFQAGRAESALTFLPPAPKEAPVKWLKALVLRAAYMPGPARKLFEQLAQGRLADRALHLAALCAIDQGDGKGAERLLGQVSQRYVDADQVLLEWARQYSRSHVAGPKTAARVEEIFAPIFSGDVRTDMAPAHLIAGDAHAAAGEKEKARAHYRAAWVDRPLSAAADSARVRERQLGPGPPVPPLQLVKRAEILLEAHRNHEAVDQLARIPLPSLCQGACPGDRTPAGFLQAAINALAPDALPVQHEPTAEDVAKNPVLPADPLACRARLDQGRAYRKEHDYGRARAALGPVVLRCADPDVRARGLYLLAQLETMGGRPTASSLWEALA